MDAAAVSEKIADRDCTEHPVLDAVLVKYFLIGDVVGEAIVCVAFDFDAEDVLDCCFVSDECCAGDFYSSGEFSPEPAAVYLFQAYLPCTADGSNQPYILLEQFV